MHAAAEFAPAIDQSERDRETQRDHIVRLLDTGDEEARSCLYAEATLTYYSIFQPGLCGEPSFGLRRVAPLELYEEAASRLRMVATKYAEQLIECRYFLAGESPDDLVGIPRGALNLYLISNQYEVFAKTALQFVAEELSKRNINRFLMSSVRARLDYLRSVRACTILLKEEQDALENLDNFESRLYAYLLLQRQASNGCPKTEIRRMENTTGQSYN